jgi:hypothetical protein
MTASSGPLMAEAGGAGIVAWLAARLKAEFA